MEINNATLDQMGRFAREAYEDLFAKSAEIDLLELKDRLSGTHEHADQIAQDKGAMAHDSAVIKANEGLTQLLVMEQTVQEEARKRALKQKEEAVEAEAAASQQQGQAVSSQVSAVH